MVIAGLGAGPPTVYVGTTVDDGAGLAVGVAEGVGAALVVAAPVGCADGIGLPEAATAELPG